MASRTNPFMPFIEDFEKEAELFLTKYEDEDAIETPQVIDINKIVSKDMSLDVIDTEKLSSDYSVQGIIALSAGIVEVFDFDESGYLGYEVEVPTVFVDSDYSASAYRNVILAHEAFHWYKHRHYFLYRSKHDLGSEFAFRCNKKYAQVDANNEWTDEQKMEWQARKIAPMILMPKKALIKKVYELANWKIGEGSIGVERETILIRNIANFYNVPIYVAAKRLVDIGFALSADDTYVSKELNTTSRHMRESKPLYKISKKEAFELYCRNELFRDFLDSGLFRYSGFGITARIQTRAVGDIDYLAFRKIKQTTGSHEAADGVMFQKRQTYEEKYSFRNTPHNAELFDRLQAYERQFSSIHDRNVATAKTANEMMFQYMQNAKWNTSIFQEKTLLSAMDYTRIQNKDYKFKLPAYVAMAVGLNITLQEFQEILQQAGLNLKRGDIQHDAYAFLLTIMNGVSIDECNEFLESIGVETLGTHERSTTWSGSNFK